MIIDEVTFWLWVAVLPVWLVWELALLRWRSERVMVKTISMVARDHAWHLNSMVYFWGGMGTHWFVPGPWPAGVVPSVVFWLVNAALLVQDVVLWRTDRRLWSNYLRWQRFPALWLVIGSAAGILLFPQRGDVPW